MTSDFRTFLVLTAAILATKSKARDEMLTDPDKCFQEEFVPYIKCSEQTNYQPSVCDCGDREECYIKLVITRNPKPSDEKKIFSINGGRIGPTIIINENKILAVDVINNIDDEGTSIHWHGMRQRKVPWMDGVANVTQYAIPPKGGKFRYIIRAYPCGTHWYHSHVGYQRDHGLFGALIVNEGKETWQKLIDSVRVEPDNLVEDFRFTLSVTEHMRISHGERNCTEDGSREPVKDEYVSSFQINGVILQKGVDHIGKKEPSYTVEKGKYYRFRVIGAVEVTAIRVSIDGHRLTVISTDGYLTRPFETDILHVHVGERYDFVVKTQADVDPGTIFPIRIESVEVYCSNHTQPAGVGIVYLKYSGQGGGLTAKTRCTQNCVALNCPFENYPKFSSRENAPSIQCYNIYDALRLLIPAKPQDLPPAPAKKTYFFNFDVSKTSSGDLATINDVEIELPDVPFVMTDGPANDDCAYFAYKNCGGKCAHAILVDKHVSKSYEFVFSSIPREGSGENIANQITHPMHMHGHSFWVKKIAYPEYHDNGTIKAANKDILVPECGHAHWRDGIRPSVEDITSTTVPKDVITVSGGGYVVIEFMVDNPGWWFMHCHIDYHLIHGMGLVIGEQTACQNPPPEKMMSPTDEFCWTVEEFREKEMFQCPSNSDNVSDDEDRRTPNERDDVEVKSGKKEQKPTNSDYREDERPNSRMIWSRYMKDNNKLN
ncbi:laccase-3-like [Dendronephthya gigantea]|uniref:laccase-3-like n=1 Tax=Dendronephthya gigantea TaxID=151771 RepID=UPI001068E3E9|nr:laccase-3-like [Dendronephthya gigantea]